MNETEPALSQPAIIESFAPLMAIQSELLSQPSSPKASSSPSKLLSPALMFSSVPKPKFHSLTFETSSLTLVKVMFVPSEKLRVLNMISSALKSPWKFANSTMRSPET